MLEMTSVNDGGGGAAASGGRPKAKVFISYSRKDMAFADCLEAGLKARGFEPLIDRTEIYAFEDWWKRVQVLIAAADTASVGGLVLQKPGLSRRGRLRWRRWRSRNNKF